MTGKEMLDAIGGISDQYIEEFAAIKPKKKMIWGYLAAAAACVCLILTVVLIYPKGNQPDVEPTMPEGNVIWGSTLGDVWMEGSGQAEPGEVVFALMLEEAFAQSENPTDIFAIRVEETTGATPERVYEEFIKPLGIYEEYLEKGLIFATQEQAKGIAASDAFGVVLDLAFKSNDNDSQDADLEVTAPVEQDKEIAEDKTDDDTIDNSNTVIDIIDMTEPPAKQPEVTAPTQPGEKPTEPVPGTGNTSVSVINIVDRVEQEGLLTFQALELFYEDGEYEYYFPSIRSSLVCVEYTDGTQKPIKEALAAGDVTIADLDRFGIGYYKESLTKKPAVTEPPVKQPEVTAPTQPGEKPTEPVPGTGNTSVSVINIVDRVEQEGLLTFDALELFYEDGEYEYYFPSIRSSLVYVEYTDGTQKPIKEALAAGDVIIADLDRFGILYYKESLT